MIERKELNDEVTLNRAVVGRSGNMLPYQKLQSHKHQWGQLAFASEGLVVIRIGNQQFIVPSNKAMWIPAEVPHEVSTTQGAKIRSLYFNDELMEHLPSKALGIEVTPFLRELILELVGLGEEYEVNYRIETMTKLLLIEVREAKNSNMYITLPEDRRLQIICGSIMNNPSNKKSLDDWARVIGASSRTINRLFQRETNMNFTQWRQSVRLVSALEALSNGLSVTEVAFNTGYDSPSAFINMFKKNVGVSPGYYQSSTYKNVKVQ